MKELFNEAYQLIEHEYNKAKFIHEILKWPHDMRDAFMLAWSIYHEDEI